MFKYLTIFIALFSLVACEKKPEESKIKTKSWAEAIPIKYPINPPLWNSESKEKVPLPKPRPIIKTKQKVIIKNVCIIEDKLPSKSEIRAALDPKSLTVYTDYYENQYYYNAK